MSSEPAVDIVTVTYDSAPHLAAYVEGVSALDYPPERLRLVVVDNASNDDTRRRLSELLPQLPFAAELVESERNAGFGAACDRPDCAMCVRPRPTRSRRRWWHRLV